MISSSLRVLRRRESLLHYANSSKLDSLDGRLSVDSRRFDLLDDLESALDSTKHGVFLIEHLRAGRHDEKRRVGGVRIREPCHRYRPELVQLVVELGLEVSYKALLRFGQWLLAGGHVTGLHDEPLHHAMLARAVVHASRGKPEEVADVLGRLVRREADGDISERGFENGTVLRKVDG